LPFSELEGRQNWSADKRCAKGCAMPQIIKRDNRIVCGRCGAEMISLTKGAVRWRSSHHHRSSSDYGGSSIGVASKYPLTLARWSIRAGPGDITPPASHGEDVGQQKEEG
jgi:hypothetical protein